jgi:hypothetical protein
VADKQTRNQHFFQFRMAAVTADWVMFSWTAAWETCPASAVATKYFNCRKENAMPITRLFMLDDTSARLCSRCIDMGSDA